MATQDTVFVSRRIPQAGLSLLDRPGITVEIGQDLEDRGISREDLITGVERCDVLVSLLTEGIDRELLERNSSLRGVCQMAVGYDNIDLAAATELGIPVTNTPGVLTETTADFTWALLMAVARRIPEAHRYTVAGRYRIWGPNLLLGVDVGSGARDDAKTLGIVGYGRIGRAVARRSTGFGMQVLAHSPGRRERIEGDGLARWAELSDLLEESDFVSLHAPLTPQTYHLIGKAEFERMKPSAFLINTARGDIVDEQALVAALESGEIAGAALDVFEHEPALAAGLAESPRVVLAPHIASASVETRGRMAVMAARNALACAAGRIAPNVLNPEVYERASYHRRIAR